MTFNEPNQARLEGEDRQLVDLVTAVLVDPNVHTDTRMRLAEEIRNLLRSVDEDLYSRASRRLRPRSPQARAHQARDLLTAALVDPNLHTDTCMRIHREISDILSASSNR